MRKLSELINNPCEHGFNYLYNIDEKNKVVYLETPKVACTAIKKYMQDKVNGEKIKYESNSLVHNRSLSPLKSLSDYDVKSRKEILIGTSYKRFTFVRNPYTRILSAYLDKIVNNDWEKQRHYPVLGFPINSNPSFELFLNKIKDMDDLSRDIHFRTQSGILFDNYLPLDNMGFFESFSSSFINIKKNVYNDDDQDVYSDFGKHHSTSASKKINEYYTESCVELVKEIYAKDFDAFSYSTNIKLFYEAPKIKLSLYNQNIFKKYIDGASLDNINDVEVIFSEIDSNPELLASLFRSVINNGIRDESIFFLLEKAIRKHPNSIIVNAQYGHYLYFSGQVEKSLSHWDYINEKFKFPLISRICRIRCLLFLGFTSNANEELRLIINKDNNPGWALNLIEKIKKEYNV